MRKRSPSRPASKPRRIAVVGGGVTGLAACHFLEKKAREAGSSLDITLLEGSPRWGGAVETTRHGDALMEHGPDCFLSSKPGAKELAEALGLKEEIIGTNPEHRRSFILKRGKLQPIPEGFFLLAPTSLWALARAPLFSFSGKLRMAMDLVISRRSGDDDVSLADFVRRRLGREALERFAEPMVASIYTADPEKLSLSATFPQFLEMEREYGSLIRGLSARSRAARKSKSEGEMRHASGPRYSLFLSFRRGIQTLTDALAESLRKRLGAAKMRLGARAASLEHRAGTWRLTLQNREAIEAEAVCLALPAYAAAALLQPAAPSLADELQTISYGSCAVLNILCRRRDIAHPLDGMGFVAPSVEKRALLSCSFSHVKFEGRAPEGLALLRAFVGGEAHAALLEASDETLRESALAELKKILGLSAAPLEVHIRRYPKSIAQYHVGHLKKVERIESLAARLGGLALAGNAYRGVGIPDCVCSAERAAEALVERLG
jgi:oxygen-dependent protoporphyrinogen oxidase